MPVAGTLETQLQRSNHGQKVYMLSLTQRFTGTTPELSDAEWEFLETYQDDPQFGELFFDGALGWDRAAAEAALLDKFALITGNDAARMGRLFRNSSQYTPRWDAKDAGATLTYGELAIAEAILRNPDPQTYSATRVVDRILDEGQIAIVTGYYNVGKSPLVLHLAFAVQNGLPWLGREVQQRDVVLLDLETPSGLYHAQLARLQARFPEATAVPKADLFMGHRDPDQPIDWVGRKWRRLLSFLKNVLKQCTDPLIVIDPFEAFFRFHRGRSMQVISLLTGLRDLLAQHPQASILVVMNLSRRRRRHPPSLLTAPLAWLEGNAGTLDLLIRADVRLGFDFHDDPSLRVLNGVRRGEDGFQPILLRSVSSPSGPCGFEEITLSDESLELQLTPCQREYWRRLPQEFKFEPIVKQGIVPRVSLSRLMKAARSMGLLVSEGGVHRKRGSSPFH